MTRLTADSQEMDHVTILLARVCASRLDATIAAEDFVRMVARLVDVAVAEAIEDHDTAAPRSMRCMYCLADVSAGPHECERMRELGFLPRVNEQPAPLDDSLSLADNVKRRAEQPAAPAAGGNTTSLSQESVAPATGVAASDPPTTTKGASLSGNANDRCLPAGRVTPPGHFADPAPHAAAPALTELPIAVPASSKAAAPLSPSTAADGAGTPAAGVSAGEQGSQAKRRGGRTSKCFTAEQAERLCAEYTEACRANDGKAPYGWLSKKAKELGAGVSTIYRYIQPAVDAMEGDAKPSLPTLPPQRNADSPAARIVEKALKVLASDPPPPRPPPSVKQAEPELVHTETPQCWCRKKRPSRENVWCKLRAFVKPAGDHAALREPEPRVERFKVRRMEGTRY